MPNNLKILQTALGGRTGGDFQDSTDGEKSCVWHFVTCLEDCTFTTITAIDKDGSSVNMVTENGLDELPAGTEFGCIDLNKLGYISTIELSSGSIMKYRKTISGDVEPELTYVIDSSGNYVVDSSGNNVIV